MSKLYLRSSRPDVFGHSSTSTLSSSSLSIASSIMVKIVDFHISFDQQWSVYHPGENVTGTVDLSLSDNVYCDSIQVLLYGSARVFWTEREPCNGQFKTVVQSSEKQYVCEKKTIWQYSPIIGFLEEENCRPASSMIIDSRSPSMLAPPVIKGHERPHLRTGHHRFTFSVNLPDNIPTTFEVRDCPACIRYFVKVSLAESNTIRHSRKAYFSVVKPADLNQLLPAIGQPLTKKVCAVVPQERSCCFPAWTHKSRDAATDQSERTGLLTSMVSLPKTGFVPGEPITVTVYVENGTGRSVKMVNARLKQTVTCFAENPEFRMKTCVRYPTAICQDFSSRKSQSNSQHRGSTMGGVLMDAEQLYVPAVVPTFCDVGLIEAAYSLLIEVCLDRDRPSLVLEVPIVIGSVPIAQINGQKATIDGEGITQRHVSARTAGNHGHSIDSNGPPPSYESMNQDMPPTYEESALGLSDVGSCNETVNYVPRYVTYSYKSLRPEV